MRVGKIAKGDYELRHVCPPAWDKLAPIGRIFIKFYIREIFENLSKKKFITI
jgi:hypothetical protein